MGAIMPNKFDKIFGWGVAAIIIAAIIGGLMMVGGPSKARDEKIDAKRLSNMQQTAHVISCYVDNETDVPQTSQPAKTAFTERTIFPQVSDKGRTNCASLKWETDPVTKEEFEFNRLGENSFELCAVFIRKSNARGGQYRSVYNRNRNVLDTTKPRENAGRHCYSAKNWHQRKR